MKYCSWSRGCCLLDYVYFKNDYKITAIDLSKKTLDYDLKAIQKIHFTGNLDQPENAKMFFLIEEAKETILDFSQRTIRVLWMWSATYFSLI